MQTLLFNPETLGNCTFHKENVNKNKKDNNNNFAFFTRLGGNSQNFLRKFRKIFVTLGLEILGLIGLKVYFEADII